MRHQPASSGWEPCTEKVYSELSYIEPAIFRGAFEDSACSEISSFQFDGCFDSVLGDINLNSNQIADFKDNLSPDNSSEESTLTQNIPREL